MDAYISAPDIRNGKISFVANDSLWIMDLEERKPRIIASGMGIITNGRFSPDGKWIVFRAMSGNDAGIADLFLASTSGSEVRRLTYFGGKSTSRRMYTDIAGWLDSTTVIASTDALSPFMAMTELYSISIDTGIYAPMKLGPAAHIIFDGNSVYLGRNTWDMLHWKGYRGGTRGKIWKGSLDGEFSKFVELETHVSSPAKCGDRIFFITDRDGTGQIYSVSTAGGDMKVHTSFSELYPRNLSSDGKRIVFTRGGRLYMLNVDTGECSDLTPSFGMAFQSTMEKLVKDSKFEEDIDLSRSGSSFIEVYRGSGTITGIDDSPIIKIPASCGRVRLARFLGNESVLFTGDPENREEIFKFSYVSQKLQRFDPHVGSIENIVPSPDGQLAALTNGDFHLFILDLRTWEIKDIDHNTQGQIYDLSWSPDSTKIAYVYPKIRQFLGGHEFSTVKIYDLKAKQFAEITTDNSRDHSPSFSPDGKILYYLSDRILDPVSDRFVFDFGFQMITKPFAVYLDTFVPPYLEKIPEELLPETYRPVKGNDLKLTSTPTQVRSGNLFKLRAVTGALIYLRYEVEGGLKYYNTGEVPSATLVAHNIDSGEDTELCRDTIDYRLSEIGNKVHILVRAKDNSLRKFEITLSQDVRKIKILRDISIDTGRISCTIDPVKEWKQMFLEAWRLARDNFWNAEKAANLADSILKRYLPLLNLVTSRYELSQLIREMQGEFRTSHSYEMGGDLTDAEFVASAKLGADFEYRDGKFLVSELYMGDPSNENEKSPLLMAGFANIGDEVLRINGVTVDKTTPPWKALLNMQGRIVNIELGRQGEVKGLPVRAMKDDRFLRYRAWVEKNRETVHRISKGRIGYVHIPDMGVNGFNEFSRLYGRESTYDGLIVDVRYNGGGSVSQIILEKLSRIRLGYDQPRHGGVHSYPADSVNGPLLAITNENAGSDGDIFSHAFKLLGLGPLVGTRTWGGVVGINPRRKLADGTTVTQPEFALWFRDVKFGIENYGTDPTDVVEYPPSSYRQGKDPQLEYAVRKILEITNTGERRVDFSSP